MLLIIVRFIRLLNLYGCGVARPRLMVDQAPFFAKFELFGGAYARWAMGG